MIAVISNYLESYTTHTNFHLSHNLEYKAASLPLVLSPLHISPVFVNRQSLLQAHGTIQVIFELSIFKSQEKCQLKQRRGKY